MTGALEITEVDPFDPVVFDPWHAAYAEAVTHGRDPDNATVWTLEELRVLMQDQHGSGWRTGWSGRVGDRVVATGFLRGSNLDNLDAAEIEVTTVPAERGQGYAGAMLEHVETAALEAGRPLLTTEVAFPYDAGPTGEGVSDLEFAAHRGYVLSLVDVQRQLLLPVADELVDRLAAEAAPFHEGYELRSFEGPVPDDLVVGWAELAASLMTEAPLGELEREPEAADVDALRASEAVLAKQGRTKFNTAAISPDGEVVAYTDIAITIHESHRAYQWGTLVRSDHRGHRLGLAVKAANLRLLQERAPQARRLVTWNAEVNAHMVGVNDRLGYQPTERLGELQKKLAQ